MRRVSSSVRRLARGVVAAGAALTVALAPAAALPALAGGATGAGTSVLLRLTFRQGETRRYTLDVDLAARVEGLESLEGLGAAVPAVPRDGESFAAHLRLDTSDTVLAVFPDGSADVRTTLDAWSLTVQGRPQDLPPGVNGLAIRRRLQPDGASTVIGLDGPDTPPGAGQLPALPALPSLPALPPLRALPGAPGAPGGPGFPGAPGFPGTPANPVPVPGAPGRPGAPARPGGPGLTGLTGYSPDFAFGAYPALPLRLGESLVDRHRLTDADLPAPFPFDVAFERRLTLTELRPAGGRQAARLVTSLAVPFSAQLDEPGISLRGALDGRLTQDVDRATGWPIAADGTLSLTGTLSAAEAGARLAADVRLRMTLRER